MPQLRRWTGRRSVVDDWRDAPVIMRGHTGGGLTSISLSGAATTADTLSECLGLSPAPAEAGLCKGSTEWDTESGGASQWIAAAERCLSCPIFDECLDQLDTAFPGWGSRAPGHNPAGMVWAARVFDEDGALIGPKALVRRAKADRAARRRREQGPSSLEAAS